MADGGFPKASQTSHPANRIIRYIAGSLGPGFLMTHGPRQTSPELVYHAYFTDGKRQVLPGGKNPDGTPNQDRVTNYKPPAQLTAANSMLRVLPSKFSGLMRTLVGTYHRGGQDAPFAYSWPKTHGLLRAKITPPPTEAVPLPEPRSVDAYWVVEISPNGLYIAPIKIDNFATMPTVQQYMPSRDEIEADSSLQQYRDQLSLSWAYDFKNPGRVVVKLIPGYQLVELYENATPFVISHGWAFSASGRELQCVGARASSTPMPHFKCWRYKIHLTPNEWGSEVTSLLVTLDAGTPYVPWIADIFWVPSEPGVWHGLTVSNSNPGTDFPTQSAPVMVYYAGETEQVVRYTQFTDNIPAFQTPDFHPNSTQSIPWDGAKVAEGDQFNIHTCVGDLGTHGSLTLDGGEGEKNDAYTAVSSGFSIDTTSFAHESYSSALRRFNNTVSIHLADFAHPPFSNNYTLSPECQYYNDSGVLITQCFAAVQTVSSWNTYYTDRGSYTEAKQWLTGLVPFIEEREAVLIVRGSRTDRSGSWNLGEGQATYSYRSTEAKIDSTACPFPAFLERYNLQFQGTGLGNYPGDRTNPPQIDIQNGAFSDTTLAGYAWSLLRRGLVSGAEFATTNDNLSTFLFFSPFGKTEARSKVFIMRGNMTTTDKTLTPENQQLNEVNQIDGPVVTNGGFAVPTEFPPISFVGKA